MGQCRGPPLASFVHSLSCCYAEVVHWKRNLFKVPSGKVGNSFVKEITRFLRAYTESSALESVALKAVMVMPHLLLQKSHRTSKARDHIAQLDRRLKTWSKGDLDPLLHEGHTIQRQLTFGSNRATTPDRKIMQQFAKFMLEEKVRAALRLVTEQERGGLLPLDSVVSSHCSTSKTVCDVLQEKHPSAQPPSPSAIYNFSEPIIEPHLFQFDQIDGPLIQATMLWMDDLAGPSGIDAAGWKCLCTSFRSHSSDLCNAIASLQRESAQHSSIQQH